MQVGVPDPPLVLVSGMVAVSEPVNRVGLIKLLDGNWAD
jgi:hypothetical protein